MSPETKRELPYKSVRRTILAATGHEIAVVSGPQDLADNRAALIVRCVNSHDALVEALQKIAARCSPLASDTDDDRKRDLFHAAAIADAALKASGEPE